MHTRMCLFVIVEFLIETSKRATVLMHFRLNFSLSASSVVVKSVNISKTPRNINNSKWNELKCMCAVACACPRSCLNRSILSAFRFFYSFSFLFRLLHSHFGVVCVPARLHICMRLCLFYLLFLFFFFPFFLLLSFSGCFWCYCEFWSCFNAVTSFVVHIIHTHALDFDESACMCVCACACMRAWYESGTLLCTMRLILIIIT